VTVTDSLTRSIVDTALGIEFADLPVETAQMVRLAVLDLFACAVAGAEDDCARITADWVRGLGGGAQSAVFGTSLRAPAAFAAYANATSGHALDYDDVSLRMIHPSTTLVPALFAVAERDHRGGAELLTAYAAGFEVQARICASVNPEHYSRGWHTTGTIGVLGAAVGVGRLLGLDEDQLTSAIGIAAASAKGIRKNFGSMVKPLHAGHAAMHGVEAAELAARGFTADTAIFDGRNGWLDVFTTAEGGDAMRAAFASGAPLELVTSGIGIKRYACCGALHPALDAMERLRADPRVRPENVVRIEGRMNALAPQILVHHDAKTGLEGKFSLEYSLATYLLHGRAGLAQYTDEAAADPELIRLMGLVDFVVDESLPVNLAYFASVVTVELADGQRLTERVDVQRGYPELPLTPDEVIEKVRDCCTGRLDEQAIAALIAAMSTVEAVTDVAEIAALLQHEAAR
jgi:2-methylcitrate dehydratase PrpD